MAQFLRRWARATEGAQAIESAFVIPVIALAMFGVTEFGRALSVRAAMQSAVEDAARCAAIDANKCGSVSAVQTYAAGRMYGAVIPASGFSVTTPACGHQVSVTYAISSVVPTLVPLPATLSARACHP